ncbi:hypothetical protein O3P69_007949 [Scylla paramamosain]|uniref:Uncharacterized protein n=1 Tax=Scylla paramamosain TaxID=85552 RepID=A0AAW0T333_SCYPA
MLDLEEFIENPSVGALVPLPKSQWARLATHFQLEVRASFNKAHLQNIVLEHLVDENIFSQEEVEEAFPAFIGDTEGAKLSIERDRIRLELLREQNRAREMSRDDKAENGLSIAGPPLLSNVFTGAARQAYTALTAEESRDYSTIKSTVLRAYERVPSHYRKIFRSTLKQPNQTCVEFFREKMAQAKRWVDSEGVGGSYKKLLELFVYEEVKSSMPPQLQSYLEGLGKHDLESAGPASDHYLILNPNVHFSRKVPLSQSALQPNSTVMGSRESASTSHLSGRPRFTPSASGESANRDGEVPLCRIYLQSPVVSGYITAGIVDELPVDGVSLVLGNVTVENMPGQTAPSTNHGNPPDPMPPKVSPVCVVTRSASRRMASNAPSEPHPSKTTIGNTVGHDTLSPEFSLQDFFQQAGKEPDPPESSLNSDPVVHCIEGTPVTRSTLIAEQARDPQLKALKECFLDESAAVPLAAYVKRFRERMCIAQRVASEKFARAQVKMKAHYDQTHKVQSREFHPGDQVLVFLPLHLSPFQSRFCGPYKIVVILVRLFPLFTTEISYRTVEKEGVRVGQLPTQQVVSLVDLEEKKGRNSIYKERKQSRNKSERERRVSTPRPSKTCNECVVVVVVVPEGASWVRWLSGPQGVECGDEGRARAWHLSAAARQRDDGGSLDDFPFTNERTALYKCGRSV